MKHWLCVKTVFQTFGIKHLKVCDLQLYRTVPSWTLWEGSSEVCRHRRRRPWHRAQKANCRWTQPCSSGNEDSLATADWFPSIRPVSQGQWETYSLLFDAHAVSLDIPLKMQLSHQGPHPGIFLPLGWVYRHRGHHPGSLSHLAAVLRFLGSWGNTQGLTPEFTFVHQCTLLCSFPTEQWSRLSFPLDSASTPPPTFTGTLPLCLRPGVFTSWAHLGTPECQAILECFAALLYKPVTK